MSTSKWTTTGPLAGVIAASARSAAPGGSSMSAGASWKQIRSGIDAPGHRDPLIEEHAETVAEGCGGRGRGWTRSASAFRQASRHCSGHGDEATPA